MYALIFTYILYFTENKKFHNSVTINMYFISTIVTLSINNFRNIGYNRSNEKIKNSLFKGIKFVFQMVMNLSKGAREIAAPMAIYIAQLVHIFLQFWQAQFLLDYSIVPCESM